MIRRMYDHLEEILCVVLVGGLLGVVSLQVFCNLVLGAPLSWSEELGKILLVWTTMIGASLALKKGEHFAVEVLHARLPARARRPFQALVAVAVILFAAILLYEGILMVIRNVAVRTPAMEIPRAIPFAAIPAGGALMLLRGLHMLIRPGPPRQEVAA